MKDALAEPSAAPRGKVFRWLGFAAVLLVRAAVFPFAQNFYGDPAVRLKALATWMAHPFFLRSFVVAHQFGPLHLYLLALAQSLHRDLDVSPRFVSLVFGSLTAFPLFRLAERRFGATAALLSTLGLAIYPLHIQTSTTATSEAVFLFFLLSGLAALDRAVEGAGSQRHLALAGLLMACACGVRYDGFLYAPLSWLWLWRPLDEKRISRSAPLLYAALTLAVPAFLCFGNWLDLGDPLYVFHFIDADHRLNAVRTAAAMGRVPYAFYCLLFWPLNLAWELTPPFALGVAWGAARAIKRREAFDLLVLAAVPAALFTFEGAFLLRFAPLARFTLPTAVLLLPYAGDGLLAAARALTPRLHPVAAALGIASALAVPVYLAARTLGHGDWYADTLRPVSPISNLPPDLSASAAWLRAHAAGKRVEVETNWLYEELPIELYGKTAGATVFTPLDGAPPPGFEPPDLLVLPKEADALKAGTARWSGDELFRGSQRFHVVERLGQVAILELEPSQG